ncbi:unnamed protein product [Rotaria sp. Silwood1]|nr:unnamed protein product [Rotaria sp. Silwood1]CAF1283078.1 unnamed protein product [Rotaria sp. Silwood1]CAF3503022.1 unnamed protein product [Rotaria sp. Silwood1]CAF3514054.1 unnamed protein product [Rotaria sp. Silwood1]CAF3570611.1 unnamed protein product [Rotaria sp. Silwood1]
MLVDIAVQILRVVLTTFIILGTIGNGLNLFIFTRPTLSKSSCTLYLIAASIDNILVIYISLLTRLLANGFSLDVAKTSDVMCKLRFYFGYVFFALSPYFYTLACFDRYCSSSASATRRSLCNKKVAKRLIIGAIILACILYFHMAIFFQIITEDSMVLCDAQPGLYELFYRIFYLVIYCILPSFCMAVLCILTLMNIHKQTRRIQPVFTIGNDGSRRLEHHLIRMLFAQIITQVLSILPFAILNLVGFLTDRRTNLFEFFNQIFTLPLFISYATSFYIFTMSSYIYRQELLRLFWFRKARGDERKFSLQTLVNGQNTLTKRKGTTSKIAN